MTARNYRHRLRQRQRQRQRERERAQARKRVLGTNGSNGSPWIALQAKVSHGVSELGKRAAKVGAAAKRKAKATAKPKPKTKTKTKATAAAKKSAASPSTRKRLAAKTRKTAASRSPKPKKKQATTKAKPSRTKRAASRHHDAPLQRGPLGTMMYSLFQFILPKSWWARLGLGLLLFAAVIVGTVALGIYVRYKNMAADYDLRQIGRMPQESVVFDTQGKPFTRLHGDGRMLAAIDQVSPHFIDALIAREDTRFQQHGGIDLFGVGRAMVRNAREGGYAQGASTLTMQLARISFDLREKTVHRKMVEAMLARRIEDHYSKEDILFYYINRVFLGSGLYGIEAAARAHFGKPASDLTLGESAMLAGVIRAPNRFSPFRHYPAALHERNTVLDRMLELEVITSEQAEAARNEIIRVLPQGQVLPADLRANVTPDELRQESYLSEALRQEVERLLTPEQLQSGGLDIYTTFDLDLQHATEEAVERRLQAIEASAAYPHPTRAAWLAAGGSQLGQPDYLQAAVTVVDNGVGAVRAMVGGRSFDESRFNRATQSRRQAGSIFKPLVYAIAFESGLFPGTLVDDRPIRRGEIAWDTTGWGPRNSDGRYEGWQQAESGLIRSRNTMTVRVGEIAGIDAVSEMARFAGLLEDGDPDAGTPTATTPPPSPQIYIGNLGASLIALTSAYSAFANEGFRAEPYFIERIEDRRGNAIYQREPEGYRVVSPGATWLTSQILEKVMAPGGTGQSARDLGVDFPVAGKTGTTNDYHDAWFVGYSSSLSCGVWVGMDQPERIVNSGYGSRIALPIWADVMQASRELRYPTMALPQAEAVMTVELCRHSGQLATEACRDDGHAYEEHAPHAMIPRHNCKHSGSPGMIPDRDRLLDSPLDGEGEKRGFFTRLKGLFSAS